MRLRYDAVDGIVKEVDGAVKVIDGLMLLMALLRHVMALRLAHAVAIMNMIYQVF